MKSVKKYDNGGGVKPKYKEGKKRVKEYKNAEDYNEYLRRSRLYNDSLDAFNVSNQAINYLDSMFQGTPIKREIERGEQSMDNEVSYLENYARGGEGDQGIYGLSEEDYARGANKFTEDRTLSYTNLDRDFNLFSPSTVSAERFDVPVNVPNYQLLRTSRNIPTGRVKYIFPTGFLSDTDYKNLSPDIIGKITPEDDNPNIRFDVEAYEKRKVRGRDGKLYDYSYSIPSSFASINTYDKPQVKPIFTGAIPQLMNSLTRMEEQPATSTPKIKPVYREPLQPIQRIKLKKAEIPIPDLNLQPIRRNPIVYSRKMDASGTKVIYETSKGRFVTAKDPSTLLRLRKNKNSLPSNSLNLPPILDKNFQTMFRNEMANFKR